MTDCKGRRISIGDCHLVNDIKINKDGVLESVVYCEYCGKREVEVRTMRNNQDIFWLVVAYLLLGSWYVLFW